MTRASLAVGAAVVGWSAVFVNVAAAQQLPIPVGGDDAGSEAERILSGAEFQPDEPNVMDRITGWIGDRLDDLFGQLTGGGGQALGWMLLFGGVAAIGYFIFRALRGVGRGERFAAVSPHIIFEEALSLDELRAEAEEAEAAGEWKRALLARYRILVGELADRGRVEVIPGRTSGELRREVQRSSPDLAEPFGEATDLFERAWYGDEPSGAVENAHFRDLTDSMLGAVTV